MPRTAARAGDRTSFKAAGAAKGSDKTPSGSRRKSVSVCVNTCIVKAAVVMYCAPLYEIELYVYST